MINVNVFCPQREMTLKQDMVIYISHIHHTPHTHTHTHRYMHTHTQRKLHFMPELWWVNIDAATFDTNDIPDT